MTRMGLETRIVDDGVYERNVRRLKEAGLLLPTFRQLAEPTRIPTAIWQLLADIDPLEPHPLNLFRVHWYNSTDPREPAPVPDHLVLPESLTGVKTRIIVLLGDLFPMIRAHKVLTAYGCLIPRLVTGQFDLAADRGVWPSTGNYCRGGAAISRILGCRAVAVLPEGMSAERFRWLEEWIPDPEDIIRTPGSESNVKEIYDECAVLSRDPHTFIFNQFSEFGNYLAHYLCTGKAMEHVFERVRSGEPESRLRAFVAATGSAGTLAAGDYLKERYGSLTVAVEALECPTMLYNGFGEHHIQGIGDKHIPLIHNVLSTDAVTAISDRGTDGLGVLFNSEAGREYLLRRRGVPRQVVEQLHRLGFSSICNILAAVKTARYYRMDERDVLMTVATDGAELYRSENEKNLTRLFPEGFDQVHAAETYGRYLLGVATDHFLELSLRDRERIFNLGYFTWFEQQGLAIEDFTIRRQEDFWPGLRAFPPAWDDRIEEINRRTGNAEAGGSGG